jgi:hypothetical protein
MVMKEKTTTEGKKAAAEEEKVRRTRTRVKARRWVGGRWQREGNYRQVALCEFLPSFPKCGPSGSTAS